MPEPIHCPAAWRGRELLGRADWSVTLTDDDIAELERAASALDHRRLETISSEHAAAELGALGEKLLAIQDALENGSGATMIRGFPVERHDLERATRLFWILASRVGTPVSQSAAGERIFRVEDAGYPSDDARARGPNTKKKLSFHTDRCDVIGFLCWRQARSGGENDVVSSVALYNVLLERRPDLVDVLMQPFLSKRHNVDTANERPYVEQPIFSVHQGHFASNFLRVLIERAHATPGAPAMTELQREALDTLEAVAEEPDLHVRFRQEPGDVLLLNNWVTYHRRSAFEDWEQPERRRLLLRIWLSVPNSRPLDPRFAGNYGSTEAGAIRGGMRAGG